MRPEISFSGYLFWVLSIDKTQSLSAVKIKLIPKNQSHFILLLYRFFKMNLRVLFSSYFFLTLFNRPSSSYAFAIYLRNYDNYLLKYKVPNIIENAFLFHLRAEFWGMTNQTS